MRIEEFIAAAQAFANLGSAVGDQAVAVILDGEDLAEQNGNALRSVADFLADYAGDVEDADVWIGEIREHLQSVEHDALGFARQ